MHITETTRVAEPKWPRWAWFVYPALAIAIGGGLGYIVATARQETEPRPIHSTTQPVLAAPQPSSPTSETAPPRPETDLEIEVQPESKSEGPARRTISKPKAKPKPVKSTPCNVYDHMNGC